MNSIDIEKQKKVLAERYNIHNEEQLDDALRKMKPLNIGCMVSPIMRLNNEVSK